MVRKKGGFIIQNRGSQLLPLLIVLCSLFIGSCYLFAPAYSLFEWKAYAYPEAELPQGWGTVK